MSVVSPPEAFVDTNVWLYAFLDLFPSVDPAEAAELLRLVRAKADADCP